ncbi:MAG TPA: urate oxidase [Spirochaetia bacterium]|nr:urate oxidase [Spirochaetia bacterium]
MTRLADNSYGKCGVRLTKVSRAGAQHVLQEYTVQVALGGAFGAVYTDGDNSSCIPTDTMKNTVYALARTNEFDCPEAFAGILSDHFLRFDQVAWAEVSIDEQGWSRITVDGAAHPHSFTRQGSGVRTARVRRERGASSHWGGIRGLEVLKTTRSSFTGFFKDRFTTLPESTDRIFATAVDAEWEYAAGQAGAGRAGGAAPNGGAGTLAGTFEAARAALLETFALHDSASVQQTLYAMGEALLARCPLVRSVSLRMPNQHRLLVNLAPFGLENRNEIFVATSEPYGQINGTVSRE